MNYRSLFPFLCAFFMLCLQLGAQTTSNAYTNYIEQYKGMAIEQMQQHRIPASITLAQGLLESAAGQSRLARVANNHFGIKEGTGWTGDVILCDDDARNERFRKYTSVAQSYEDHSLFLKKPRYNALFQLDITDYKGWARTLKQCGYATNPRYADNLVSIIDRYNLTQYDMMALSAGGLRAKQTKKHSKDDISSEDLQNFLTAHNVGLCNGSYYIIAQQGDNLKSIAVVVGKNARKLRRYNDIPKGCDIYPGQVVYLESKASSNKFMNGAPHIVEPGESMYSISQRYGVKMSALYKINNLSESYQPRVGDRICLSN